MLKINESFESDRLLFKCDFFPYTPKLIFIGETPNSLALKDIFRGVCVIFLKSNQIQLFFRAIHET